MTDALLQNEKRLYDVVDLSTQSSNQAAEDIASLKRQMTTIVGIAFSLFSEFSIKEVILFSAHICSFSVFLIFLKLCLFSN